MYFYVLCTTLCAWGSVIYGRYFYIIGQACGTEPTLLRFYVMDGTIFFNSRCKGTTFF